MKKINKDARRKIVNALMFYGADEKTLTALESADGYHSPAFDSPHVKTYGNTVEDRVVRYIDLKNKTNVPVIMFIVQQLLDKYAIDQIVGSRSDWRYDFLLRMLKRLPRGTSYMIRSIASEDNYSESAIWDRYNCVLGDIYRLADKYGAL